MKDLVKRAVINRNIKYKFPMPICTLEILKFFIV